MGIRWNGIALDLLEHIGLYFLDIKTVFRKIYWFVHNVLNIFFWGG